MEKIFDIAKDSEQKWGVIAQGIDGNFEEVVGEVCGINLEIGNEVDCSGKHGDYILVNTEKDKSYSIVNTNSQILKLYLRKEKSSNDQQQIIVPANSSLKFTSTDNFFYIYIYNPDDTIVNFSFSIIATQSLKNDIASDRENISANTKKISFIQDAIIDNIYYELVGNADSRIKLNTPIILSKNGDSFECDYRVNCDGDQALSFAASDITTSPVYNYAIGLGRTTLRARGSDGWMMQSAVTFDSRNQGHLKIVYADSKIYFYIDDTLISTVGSQSTLTISGFGYGGNNTETYGYWEGSVANIKYNGERIDLSKATLLSVSTDIKYKFDAKKDGYLVWDATNKKMTHYEYEKSLNRYFSFAIQLVENDTYYLKCWRLVDGGCHSFNGVTFTKLFGTIYGAENEMAIMFSENNWNGGYSGGSHGGERIDGDSSCGIYFFADGRLITDADMANDFTIECKCFKYIQITTLHKNDDSRTVRAHHIKRNTFEGGCSLLENTIKFDLDDIVTQFHAGLACISKDTGKYAILPSYVLTGELTGTNDLIFADDYKSALVEMWNPINKVKAIVEGRFTEGFSFNDALPSSGNFSIWDRTTDTKYYRRTNDNISFLSGAVVKNEQTIKFI